MPCGKGDVMAENELVLNQKDILGFNLQVKLIDGRQLQVLSKGKKSEQNYSIDILSLKDTSKKIYSVAWKWLLASISFILVMLLCLKILPGYLGENKNLYMAIVLLTGIAGGAICFIKFWKYTSIKQIFYSRNADVPIITLSAGKPSKKIFLSFIDAIEKRIIQFRKHMDIDEEKQMTGEIKMLRRLSENGVVSKKAYEKAKVKLLGGFKK